MKLIYNVKDKPNFGKLVIYAIQQLLAIMTATLVVPVITNGNVSKAYGFDPGMSTAAALVGAGIGTLVYVLFTKAKSPVFLGSSFAFLGPMAAAFAGSLSAQRGFAGLLIGAVLAGLVYVIIALIVKFAGVKWINKLMPAVVIGPTVALIGLSLATNAVGDIQSSKCTAHPLVCLLVGLVTLAVTMLCSTYGKKNAKLIPFIIGILAGYAFATVLTVIGNVTSCAEIKVIDFTVFNTLLTDGAVTINTFFSVPDFTFLTAFKGFAEVDAAFIGQLAVAYVPVAFVVFAEHIADHKNISSIIETDLLENPGLHRTLLGDGIGSMAGAFFGGCPNTTYGESIGCVAITKNASVYTIIAAAVGAIIIAFFNPFVVFVNSIPSCIMGGVCMALYGFIAVSGLKMVQKVDLEDNANLFTVSTILIAGIGGLSVSIDKVTLTPVATALILGILANVMLSKKKKDKTEDDK